MKKFTALLVALIVLLLALSVYADGGTVALTFEGKTYNLTFINAEVVDGVLNVQVSGFGNSIPIRNGSYLIPFWVYAVSGGQKCASTSLSASSGTYTFFVACDCIPEEIYIYEYDDEDHAVLLWENTETAAAEPEVAAEVATEVSADAPAFCGEWCLDTIDIYTPDMDNGILTVDVTLSTSETTDPDLTLYDDGTAMSDFDVYALIEAISALPFSVPDLCLPNYTAWTYTDDTLSIACDGAVLTLVYDAEAEQLVLPYANAVEVLPVTNSNGYVSKTGMVDMEITITFVRAQ